MDVFFLCGKGRQKNKIFLLTSQSYSDRVLTIDKYTALKEKSSRPEQVQRAAVWCEAVQLSCEDHP